MAEPKTDFKFQDCKAMSSENPPAYIAGTQHDMTQWTFQLSRGKLKHNALQYTFVVNWAGFKSEWTVI
jgi:hypothetical protein